MGKKGRAFQLYIVIGMVAAIVVGTILGLIYKTDTPAIGMLGVSLGDLGSIFIGILKLLVIPLVVTSMIVGVTSLGSTAKIGRFGLTTVIYYFVTTAVAVVIGLVVVNVAIAIVEPGQLIQSTDPPEGKPMPSKSSGDILATFLPWNVVMEEGGKSRVNVLALIIDAILVGWILLKVGSPVKPVVRFLEWCNRAILKVTMAVMLLAPLGILGIVASKVGEKGLVAITGLWPYFLAVLAGLMLHAFCVLPLLLKLLGRRKVWPYASDVFPALTMAFATASSSATLPVTMECVEEKAQVDKRAANFVLPLGATVNMDGTALYEAVAVMAIAQSLGFDMTFGQQVIIAVTATLAAVGAAGIPQAGLVTMVIVMKAVDLPVEQIGIILAIDWFLDRFRTTVNVWGDTIGAAVIAKVTGKEEQP